MRRLCLLLCGLVLLCGVDAQEDQTLLGDAVVKRRNPDGPMLLDDTTWNAYNSPNLLAEAPPSRPSKATGPPDQALPPLDHAVEGSQPPLNDTNRPNKTDGNPPPPKPVALAEVLETDAQQIQEQAGAAAMEAKATTVQHAAQWPQVNVHTGVIVAVAGLALLVAGVALRARSAAKDQQAKQQREDHHLLESLLYNDMDYAAM